MAETMKAGAELDGRIAERLFGWTNVHRTGPERYVGLNPLLAHVQTRQYPTRVPRYSTDIAAAWLVVEKLREQGHDVSVAVEEKGAYAAVFHGGTTLVEWLGDPVATAPLAICLAALAVSAPSPENEVTR